MSLSRLLGKSPSEIKDSTPEDLSSTFKRKLDERNHVVVSQTPFNPSLPLVLGTTVGLVLAHLLNSK